MPVGARILDQLRRDPERIVTWLVAPDATETPVTARSLESRAWAMAEALGEGRPGEPQVAAICLFPGLDLHAAWLGAVWAGFVPSMVAPPSPRTDPAKYAAGFVAMAAHVGAAVWVVSREAADRLADRGLSLPGRVVVADAVPEVPESPDRRPAHAALDDIMLVQHSSGTTGLQKAVALTNRQVLAHTEAYTAWLGMTPDDVVVSWLPLYHDMGFIACFVTPLLTGMRLVEMSPFDWVRRPLALAELITRHRGTLCWLPNFAFAFLAAARRRAGGEVRFDLSSIRAWINCSEPVLDATCERFVDAFAADGVRWEQMTASYAMAENVYAVTQSLPGALRRFRASREAFQTGHRLVPAGDDEAVLLAVSNGRVLPTTELRVVGPSGDAVDDGAVGEIQLRGACRFAGYLRRPDLTAASIDAEGWYHTGDLGAVVDGELYVTGRTKDLIIIQGRNIYAADVEAAVGDVPGVAPGRVVAFGVPDAADGTERLVVLAEQDAASAEAPAALALRVRTHVAQALDCTAGDVRIVPARWLVKATSGKVARAETRARYLADVH